MLKRGDAVQITALRADGTPYRWWTAVVEEATPERVVAVRQASQPVHEPGCKRAPVTHWRNVYWADRSLNVTEVYTERMEPLRLCVDVASPAGWSETDLWYRDHELDVVKVPGRPAEVYDEDDFALAIEQYGYTPELQAACRSALREALELAESWIWSLPPPGAGAEEGR